MLSKIDNACSLECSLCKVSNEQLALGVLGLIANCLEHDVFVTCCSYIYNERFILLAHKHVTRTWVLL